MTETTKKVPTKILVDKESSTPALVNLTLDAPPPVPIKTDSGMSLPPTTTAAEDETTQGQRRINLLWEYTQSIIAIAVVGTTLVIGILGVLHQVETPTIISVAFGTVIGFYFARTNHQAIGGVGPKADVNQEYKGR